MKLERQEKCVFCNRIIHFGEKAFIGFESGFICCDQCKNDAHDDDFLPETWDEDERYYFTPDESNAFLVTYKGVNDGNEYFGSKYYAIFDRLTIKLDKDYKLDRLKECPEIVEELCQYKGQIERTGRIEYGNELRSIENISDFLKVLDCFTHLYPDYTNDLCMFILNYIHESEPIDCWSLLVRNKVIFVFRSNGKYAMLRALS